MASTPSMPRVTPVQAKRYIPPKSYVPPKVVARQPIKPPPAIKRPPHEFPQYEAPESACYSAPAVVSPKELHKLLEVAPYVRINFDSEKKLNNFRQNLYHVNTEGRFRYATRREGWTGLIILRLK
jgi:hypothetical protein